ncbi:MAG: TolC family protein [Acidobacteriota bacterium]
MLNLPFRAALAILMGGASAFAQTPPPPAAMNLNLAQAEQLAVRNNPAISAAVSSAQAAAQGPLEARSGLLPTVFGSATGVGADSGSRLAAGALNNPVVYSRLGTGLTVNQLITDFGRTRSLVEASKFHAAAEGQIAESVRANIVLETDRAYYALLRAQSVLTVSEQTVSARQLVSDQVTQLAKASLKSQLDVSFANVNLAQAKIQLSGARNQLSSAAAELATVIGLPEQRSFVLADEPLPAALDPAAESYIQAALEKRPELANLRLEVSAAERNLHAERALSYPTIGVIGTAGFVPAGEPSVPGRYGAIGANINIPILNGGLFKARRTEAELRLQAVSRRVDDLRNRIVRDVRTAWLDASTAFEQVDLTAQLLDQAKLALDLAQGRYELGLSSIVELSQAQLNLTSAQIAGAGAKFDYLAERSYLAYEAGTLR